MNHDRLAEDEVIEEAIEYLENRGLATRMTDAKKPMIATADGQYDFQGRMYPSLSMIAREITGMRWSGPLFFGLKPPSNAKTKPTTKKRGGR